MIMFTSQEHVMQKTNVSPFFYGTKYGNSVENCFENTWKYRRGFEYAITFCSRYVYETPECWRHWARRSSSPSLHVFAGQVKYHQPTHLLHAPPSLIPSASSVKRHLRSNNFWFKPVVTSLRHGGVSATNENLGTRNPGSGTGNGNPRSRNCGIGTGMSDK